MTTDFLVKLDIVAEMRKLGEAARAAAAELALASAEAKSRALRAAAVALNDQRGAILAANARDMAAAEQRGLTPALLDRLKLDEKRIAATAKGLDEIAAFPDPVGAVLAEWTRPNGLRIQRVRVPLGVIGIIYESRPNVTADAGGIALKAGNAAILRGGSESFHSSRAIHGCLVDGLKAAGLPVAAIQLMPVIAHLEGNCHTYVDGAAEAEMARRVVLNAKMRRTGVCGATETLLVDRRAAKLLPAILQDLLGAGCEVRGDAATQKLDARVKPATAADWDTEFLDAIIAVKLVEGVDGAIAHINRHGSHHTEAIITENQATAERFLARVDAAIVLHNGSTQFADGGEFGMGAEIGISTGKLPPRGPVGAEQLTSYKYVVRGTGQVRP
jgi:glutamate-5-semialdehyde dehydrogenase